MKKAVVIPAHIFERFKNSSENIDKQNAVNENKIQELYDTPENIEKTINRINNSGIGLDRKNFLYQQFLFKILRVARENNLDIKLPILEYIDPSTSTTSVTPTVSTTSVTPVSTTPPSTPIVAALPLAIDDRMSRSLSKVQRVNGMQIYRIIETIPEVSWDDKGVISINGKIIPQSDIVKIVLHLHSVGKNKKQKSPLGLIQLQPYINVLKTVTNVIGSRSRGRSSPTPSRNLRTKKSRHSPSAWKPYSRI